MAQHDYVIANASGATVRADINNMALAISSNNSGSSEPGTTYAYEWWIDTGNNLLKLRNSANNAWITMPFSITANNTVDVNGGTIDGAVIGGSSAAAGTFTTLTASGTLGVSGLLTANANITLAGTTPTLTIGDGGAEDTKIVFDGNAQDYYIGLDDSADDLVIGRGSAVGTTPNIEINSSNDIHFSSADSDVKFYFGSAGGAFGSNSSHNVRASGNDFMFNSVANYIYEVGGAEKMRIDSSGNVGIGTDSPTKKLHVVETSGYPIARFQEDGASLYSKLDVENANSTAAVVVMGTGGGSVGNSAWANNAVFGTISNANVVLLQNDTERMRIDTSGNVGIGTTDTTVAKTHIVESESRDCLRLTNTRNPSSSAPYVATFGFNYQPNNGTSTFLACQDDLDGSPTNRLVILSNGGIANYQSNDSNLSDARLKTDIQDAPNALDIINNLKVRTFKYHDQTDEKIHTGLIAQETETVDLSLVNQDGWADKAPDGEEPYKSIYNTDLMFKMLKAMQEQQEQIEALKAEVDKLKG